MIRRSTWSLLALFVIVLGAGIFYQSKADEREAALATPTTAAQSILLEIDESAIASIKIEDGAGKQFVLGRDEEGLWKITEPAGGETDVAQAESGVSQLVGLRVMSRLEAAADLAIFGLNKSAYTITINMNGGQQHVISVGDITPTQNGYYVRLNGNAPQVVNKYSLDAFLQMLEQPPFQPTPTPEVSPQTDSTLESGEAKTPLLESTPDGLATQQP